MNRVNIVNFPPLGYAGQEAFNTLCTNLSFSGEYIRRIMVTSTRASEGKSYLTMNIMRTMAALGKRVALVDADLRRSHITGSYKLQFENPQQMGLAQLLAGMTTVDEVICETNIEGAYIVPVGRIVSNPITLLNSPRFKALLDYLAQNVDYVLVDAPPVGTVIDAAEIAKSCDGTLLAVAYNRVRRRELADVKEQLEQTGCQMIGTVLNLVEFDHFMTRRYYYRSYYSNYEMSGGDEQPEKKRRLRRSERMGMEE